MKCIVEKLDRELMARGIQIPIEKRFQFCDMEGTPQREALMAGVHEYYGSAASSSPDKALSHISTRNLIKMLKVKIRELNRERGIWGEDSRRDYYEITDEQIKKNANCAAAICLENNLIPSRNGLSTLKNKNYGAAFNLCACEPFNDQPIAVGRLCTGFLVKEDVVATAGHCACEKNVTDLRFVFGYKMLDSSTPATQVPNENVYKGVKIIERAYNRSIGSDWALVKLDRNVVGQEVAALSKEKIFRDKTVYIIGYPLGLPLKYSPGASVSEISETHFSADLNVYCGSSGSPVFDSETHEVIGIVVRGDNRDFRWVENCWMSVIYPNPVFKSKEPQCTRVSEFIDIVDKCCE
ncbi:MAG: trypsin-like serine protease [Candidatus Aminicenantes bacterium]|nr:trypsin-like serine protease [Candidatus Aminicenantes bacterium]NIM82365.1 trypsin-like serine protease [Candidatus Aminicenantes bacterium]NIN17540.1 trypsin-like serine protease [Candidatus Aminicenantes bacterium]NIN84192.1 trypsin-like serine protease [Candidatus Aminicenantes bacterium]NIO84784.1 trypsin-like serine protease [Candidatus Aminicenantes bacterium]